MFDSKNVLQYTLQAIYFKRLMPIIKSAKKKARQAKRHFERNKATRSMVKTYMKKVVVLAKTNQEEAKKLLPKAYSVIDTASKKNILHKNNAARKKSLLARIVARSHVGTTTSPKKVESKPKAKKSK